MIKVLRIINRFNLGGPTYNVGYLTKYLSDDFETLLVGGVKDESEASSDFIIENLGLKPIIIPEIKREINIKNDYIAYKKIKQLIQEYKPDVVHTHASKAGALGRLAASACNVPVIVHTFHGHVFHSYFGKIKTYLYKSIERYLARKSSAIVVISEKQKHEIVDVYKVVNDEKVRVVPLGFDLMKFQINKAEKRKAFRAEYKINDEEIVISIIGRLVPIKNHDLFLRGLKIVAEKTNKRIRALIIGDGESREVLENKANELGLLNTEKNILTFTSWILDVDIALAGSDIVVLTSLNEGTPVSLIEAQAANVPVISSRVGGVENIVLEGETALLFDSGDVQGFSTHLLALVEQDDLRKRMQQHSWEHVKDKFHYTRLVGDIEGLYRSELSS